MAASKIIPDAAQKHSKSDQSNLSPRKAPSDHDQVAPTVADKKNEAEYTHLFKSTIEDALFRLTNSKNTEEPLVPVKRLLIQESHEDNDSAKRAKVGSPVEKEKPNQVVYLDSDAKYEQMRLLQALVPAHPKYFMFSGVLTDTRPLLTTAIESLKGVVLETEVWDSQCTHLIVSNRIVKTEKFLAACASCSWYECVSLL